MEENNEFTNENAIIELDTEENISEETEITENIAKVEDDEIVIDLKKEEKNKKKKNKPKKEFFFKRLSKKGKIIFIASGALLLFIIAGVLIYFLVIKKDKPIKDDEPDVIVEEDNYIYENGTLKFMGDDKEVIGTYKCKDKDEKKCYVAYLSNEDEFDLPVYQDESGKVIEKRSKIYNNSFVFVYDDSKITLYDIKKQTSVGDYKLIKTGDIDASLIVIKDSNDKYGLVKISGTKTENVLDFEYEYLGIYNSDDTFVAKDGTSSYLISIDGKEVSTKLRGEIKSFSANYIALYNDDYILYNYKGEKVIDDSFDYIDFNNNYIFVMKGIKLYAYDSGLYKLNESAIKLKTSDYGKTYIFDKDNNLVETKKAYGVTIANNKIVFELNETTTSTINLLEAEVNKKYNYINYYDGVLYFYSDEDKTQMLGSYKCTNKNVVATTNDEYSNCFLAKDTKIINTTSSGYIPIINNNYAFIKDTKTGATNENIVLYDMTKSKSLSKYQTVDTGIGSIEIGQVGISNNIIYAKNADGNYGAITFESTGPKGLISFKDSDGTGTSSMKLLGDNILVKRGEINYLYDKIGQKLATSTFDIMGYSKGFTLVKNNNKYLVYTMSNGTSGTIVSEELDLIELYDDFFVGIKDKKLNVYLYTKGKEKLIEEDIVVKSNASSSYSLEVFSDSYLIKVTESDNKTTDYKYDKNWGKIESEE